jgi:hypothetical protein
MARTLAQLPKGSRITDYISLGVIGKSFPKEKIAAVLERTGKTSVRQRELPAHVVVYYVIALTLFMQVSYREVLRCLLEGLSWLAEPGTLVKVTGKSGISQARSRLGAEPLRALHDEVVRPIAVAGTRGAFYRHWRLVSLDGSTLEVADTPANRQAFGPPRNRPGDGAYPKLRFVSLVECGTHVVFGTALGGYATGEATLARQAVASLGAGMLCLCDRLFFGFALWEQARATGAELVWRVKSNLRLPCSQRLADGSYLSRIDLSLKHRRKAHGALTVRVIEYTLEGVPGAEPLYRLVTSLLDPKQAPALELAALYRQRWEIETALDELKTHLRGRHIVLRSKTPELVRQEFYGLLLAHFAIRALMHEAALKAGRDPDDLSFVHSLRVVRRKLPAFLAFPPSPAPAPPPNGAE